VSSEIAVPAMDAWLASSDWWILLARVDSQIGSHEAHLSHGEARTHTE
jgi:hypothetical protein